MGFFDKIKKGLSRTKKNLVQNIESVITGRPHLDEEFLDDLEGVLLSGDLGFSTTEKVMKQIRTGMYIGKVQSAEDVLPYMKSVLVEMLKVSQENQIEVYNPEVILVVGVNGVGKTTTIGKLAGYYSRQGKKVLLAAADTFRAAASEQLTVWAERTGADIVKHAEGADPAAVAYDAVSAAVARGVDVVIVTAGRLQTKINLMEELRKISRVIKKIIPDAPHQTLLVLDATTGQNAISQAKKFGEVVPITGVALTKLDGTAKGGVIFSVREELHVPVTWIGVGESEDDLQPFNATEFVEALFESTDG